MKKNTQKKTCNIFIQLCIHLCVQKIQSYFKKDIIKFKSVRYLIKIQLGQIRQTWATIDTKSQLKDIVVHVCLL